MRHLFLLFLFVFLLSFVCFSQTKEKDEHELVLSKKQIGKAFSFHKNNDDKNDSLVLVYLGQIKTKKGDVLSIMTSHWYWGLSHRATTRMIVFNALNQNLGNYYLPMTYEAPKKIEGTSVVFINDKAGDCTPGLVTKVDFGDGIPKEFFVRCNKDGLGDVHHFDPATL